MLSGFIRLLATVLLRPLQFTEVIEFFLATSVNPSNHAAPPDPIYRSNRVFPRYFRKSDQTMLLRLLQFTEVIEFFPATSVNPSNHAALAAPIYRSKRVFDSYSVIRPNQTAPADSIHRSKHHKSPLTTSIYTTSVGLNSLGATLTVFAIPLEIIMRPYFPR